MEKTKRDRESVWASKRVRSGRVHTLLYNCYYILWLHWGKFVQIIASFRSFPFLCSTLFVRSFVRWAAYAPPYISHSRSASKTSEWARKRSRTFARREFSYQIRYSIIMQTHKHTSNDVIVTLVHPIVIAKSCYKTALDSRSLVSFALFSLFSAVSLSLPFSFCFLLRHSLSFTHVLPENSIVCAVQPLVGSFVLVFC